VNKRQATVVFVFEFIEYVFVEYKYKLYRHTRLQCLKKGGIIIQTQIAPKPMNHVHTYATLIRVKCLGLFSDFGSAIPNSKFKIQNWQAQAGFNPIWNFEFSILN